MLSSKTALKSISEIRAAILVNTYSRNGAMSIRGKILSELEGAREREIEREKVREKRRENERGKDYVDIKKQDAKGEKWLNFLPVKLYDAHNNAHAPYSAVREGVLTG